MSESWGLFPPVLEETWQSSKGVRGLIPGSLVVSMGGVSTTIARSFYRINGEPNDRVEARMCLAAAAPELYRALMVILEQEYVGDEYRDPARAALAKARGET